MQAGKLRHLVSLQSYTVTRDVHGAVIETWAEETKFWAEYVGEGTREFIAAQKRYSELTALFRVRFRSDVTAKKRIAGTHAPLAGRVFDIKGAYDPEGRSRELLIACTEVT